MDGAEAMKIIETVDLDVIRQHGKKTGPNVTLSSYHIQSHCPQISTTKPKTAAVRLTKTEPSLINDSYSIVKGHQSNWAIR